MRSRRSVGPNSPRRIASGFSTLLLGVLCSSPVVFAGTIDTALLERPWPRQYVRAFEVGRHNVRWREAANRRDGIFAGLTFTAPLDRQQTWDLANDYSDVGQKTPGVTAVRFLERTPTRQVIQIDVKVLWKRLQLNFEVEQDPPKAIRFRLVNRVLGEFRGLCVFTDGTPPATGAAAGTSTSVELLTWLKPARPVPVGLLLFVERISLLEGVKGFLATCDHRLAAAPQQSHIKEVVVSYDIDE